MLRARVRWGRYMTSYVMSKRLSRRSRAIVAIFSVTVSGDPTNSAPRLISAS